MVQAMAVKMAEATSMATKTTLRTDVSYRLYYCLSLLSAVTNHSVRWPISPAFSYSGSEGMTVGSGDAIVEVL